ncbi:spherulation-specific family 4 protein [Streptacidiphilus sp. N1-12]|uniref:Spherulation-specific family 4 protein n=2 Tax=Streptacidiphilus alkalitolerans TaxID=3342712 RepID=A0ABV6VHW2_9ACTN
MTTGQISGRRRLLVPLYVYPGTEPGAWRGVAARADTVAWVVFNPASGPGGAPEPEFAEAAGTLRAAGIPLLGYVDTDYGRRSHREVVTDLERYQDWYPVDGVFLDQVGSAPELLPHYRRLAVAARSLDARQVVLNPGVHPDPGYAAIADVVITFEGAWEVYQRLQVPAWTTAYPARRFGHLVHTVPADDCDLVLRTARQYGAEYCYATPGTGDNPWSVLMPQLRQGSEVC